MQLRQELALLLTLTSLSLSYPQPIGTVSSNSHVSTVGDADTNSTSIAEFEIEASSFDPNTYTIQRPGNSIKSPPLYAKSDPHQLVSEASNLTSRDISDKPYYFTANDGTQDGNQIVPVKINISNAHTFLVQAYQFAVNAAIQGAEPNATTPERYFKYSSGNLALIIASSNQTSIAFSWGEFASVVDWLSNLTVPDGHFGASTQSFTLNGKVGSKDDGGSNTIFGGLVPSYSDMLHSNSTQQQQQSTDALSDTNTGGGGKRLAKRARVFSYTFGPNDEFRLRITAAATKVAYGLLAGLVNNAYDQLATDTGGALIYDHRSIFTFCGVSDCATVPGNVFDMSSFQGLRPTVAQEALEVLLKFAGAQNWVYKAGSGPAVTGEIVEASGNVLAKFGLGVKLARNFYCAVTNPDGSAAVGCLAKDEL